MKNILYILALILTIGACKEASNSRLDKPKDRVKNSPLSLKLDYDKLVFEQEQDWESVEALISASESIRLDNILIENGGQKVYEFNQNLGDIVLSKNTDDTYTILEHYIIPIGSVYGKSALLKYILDPQKGTIERDKSFKPQLTIYKYWSNHIVKEYDSYLGDPKFTSKNIEEVPFAAFEAMRYLMFNLTLATVLEDCKACEERMEKIATDYNFVTAKEYFEQNLFVCKTILKKINE